MKRKALLLLATVAALASAPAARADQLLFGFTGFDYVGPNHAGPVSGAFINQFDNYYVVGFVTAFGPAISGSVNNTTNEYTFRIFNCVANTVFFDGTDLEVAFLPNARIRAFEDSRSGGTPGTYGVLPPNATSPSTFIDGTMILGADLDNMVLAYDYSAGQGNLFTDHATLDEGTLLPLIPASQRAGWLLSGLAGQPNATVPPGYVDQLSGEMQIPGIVPTAHRSWGSIKALYR